MPAERLSLRQIREVLRLRFASKLAAAGNRQEPGAEQGAMLTKARCCAMLVVKFKRMVPIPSEDFREISAW